MITRIVKMSFKERYSDEFEAFVKKIKGRIESAEGCKYLEIMRDKHNPNIFFTYSRWQSEEHLNAYRKSELFGEYWPQTKKWFADKPEAWSVNQLHE